MSADPTSDFRALIEFDLLSESPVSDSLNSMIGFPAWSELLVAASRLSIITQGHSNHYRKKNILIDLYYTNSRSQALAAWFLSTFTIHFQKKNLQHIYRLASKPTKLICSKIYCSFKREPLSSRRECTSLFVKSNRPPISATLSTRSLSKGIVESVPRDPTMMSFFCNINHQNKVKKII